MYTWRCSINTIYVLCWKISNLLVLALKQKIRAPQLLAFLPVFKARQMNYIFVNNLSILSMNKMSNDIIQHL
jgi:hypothetical protein